MPAQDDRSMRLGDPGVVSITEPDTLEYPEYDGNNMSRSHGNILGNPNVGLLFVRLDGKTFCTPIRGKATSTTTQRFLPSITARKWSSASNARSCQTARATFQT
jgi:hypothetical protein